LFEAAVWDEAWRDPVAARVQELSMITTFDLGEILTRIAVVDDVLDS
jgi:hypothetical protein